MRDMKARSMGKTSPTVAGKKTAAQLAASRRGVDQRPDVPEPSADDGLELADVEALADGGDGQFSVRRSNTSSRRRDDDSEGEDLPDSPPPGWCDRW